ncbi:preprotein translocase SecE subunit [Rhizomicrobium palustre]|uniref:Protein translocase subunit SecE n=1 Tax=Rhizomicrobium palustre TaxID=189966 RepID=A0A846N2Y0_9PROT|nr:preprotein translocase subunit SecE [Rhizomicrobium palustre]NIK90308.1 preprotein translocase SecE subunit [Rhizomicrobium palustre]
MAEATKKTTEEGGSLPAPARRRGGLVSFYSETVREMKKVTWPTWKETYLTTIMVFIMVALTVVFFFVVDTVLAWGERLLIGAAG